MNSTSFLVQNEQHCPFLTSCVYSSDVLSNERTNGRKRERHVRMPRGISWSFNETEALIRLWADSTTQTALRLNSRNRCIYEDIANQLQAIGITRTADRKSSERPPFGSDRLSSLKSAKCG